MRWEQRRHKHIPVQHTHTNLLFCHLFLEWNTLRLALCVRPMFVDVFALANCLNDSRSYYTDNRRMGFFSIHRQLNAFCGPHFDLNVSRVICNSFWLCDVLMWWIYKTNSEIVSFVSHFIACDLSTLNRMPTVSSQLLCALCDVACSIKFSEWKSPNEMRFSICAVAHIWHTIHNHHISIVTFRICYEIRLHFTRFP